MGSTSVILLLNSWELILKAALSKNSRSIYYRKKRNQPYRTLSRQDALAAAIPLFPPSIDSLPVRRNLELLGTYRDNAVHFYNTEDFGTVIYILLQTNVTNFRDLMLAVFDIRLEDEVNMRLLPLALRPPIDPIEYIAGRTGTHKPQTQAVQQFLSELSKAVVEVQDAGRDTGRLVTIFDVKLESIRKIEKADVVIGVTSSTNEDGPLVIVRTRDPNVTHPLRQRDVVAEIGTLHGERFTSHTCQAIVWKYSLKENPRYVWVATEGVLVRYSRDTIVYIKSLRHVEVASALKGYRVHLKNRLR